MNRTHSSLKIAIPPIIFLLGVVALWHLLVTALSIPEYLIPGPIQVIKTTWTVKGSIMGHAAITMIEAILGFVLGSVIGISLAVLFAFSRSLELSIYPYTVALKSIPIIAIAPLLVLWFGNDIPSKIVTSALICFFPVVVNTLKGLRSIEPEAIALFQSLSAGRWITFKKLLFPTALPYVFSALKISTTFSIVGAIVGEFAGAKKGLGFFILQSSYWLRTSEIFVAIVVISVLSIAFFGAVSLAEKYVLWWQRNPLEAI